MNILKIRPVNALAGSLASAFGVFAGELKDPHVILALGLVAGAIGSAIKDIVQAFTLFAVAWFQQRAAILRAQTPKSVSPPPPVPTPPSNHGFAELRLLAWLGFLLLVGASVMSLHGCLGNGSPDWPVIVKVTDGICAVEGIASRATSGGDALRAPRPTDGGD
jgi:hypothetical protein